MSTINMAHEKKIRVLELYAGIGGMHFALKATSVDFEIIEAMEINPVVLSTYNHNFPAGQASPRNIEGITADEINALDVDLIVMSPPCQPYCRTGKKLDIQDARSSSFAHLLNILVDCKFKYLLLENVKGFETSDARDALIETLKKCEMSWQEFLLSPTDCDVPNSRLRYYLLAKKSDMNWCFERSEEIIMGRIPYWDSIPDSPYTLVVANHFAEWEKYRSSVEHPSTGKEHVWCVGDILEEQEEMKACMIPSKLVSKYGIAMDIVTIDSTQTNCFTKGYGTYIKGTGSYIAQNKDVCGDLESSGMSISEKLVEMKLRYFSPREVARLLCFPDEFSFPQTLSNKQRYRALGNSINVYIVAILLSLLLADVSS